MKKRILIVDDDASVRESLKKVLMETSHYEVTLACDGIEGEKFLKSGEAFDLVILDLNMPDRDGWDMLGFTTSEIPLMPVILITGMFDQLDSTMIPGICSLMKKPIDVAPLLETVERLLATSIEERLSSSFHSSSFREPWMRISGVAPGR